MTKKALITKEMILDAAFGLLRESGIESVNARSIAEKLGCTTQPVMYHFGSVIKIKEELYARADEYQTEYLMSPAEGYDDAMLGLGVRYIRFAQNEKPMFRFLFQSDGFGQKNIGDLTNDPALSPIINIFSGTAGLTSDRAHRLFSCLFFAVHGIASLLANNSMIYDENYAVDIVRDIYRSVFAEIKGEAI